MHFALIVIVVSLCGIISGKYIEMSVEVDGKEMVTKILSSRISALLQCGFDKVWWVLPQENTDTRFVELQDVLGMDKDVLRNVLQVRGIQKGKAGKKMLKILFREMNLNLHENDFRQKTWFRVSTHEITSLKETPINAKDIADQFLKRNLRILKTACNSIGEADMIHNLVNPTVWKVPKSFTLEEASSSPARYFDCSISSNNGCKYRYFKVSKNVDLNKNLPQEVLAELVSAMGIKPIDFLRHLLKKYPDEAAELTGPPMLSPEKSAAVYSVGKMTYTSYRDISSILGYFGYKIFAPLNKLKDLAAQNKTTLHFQEVSTDVDLSFETSPEIEVVHVDRDKFVSWHKELIPVTSLHLTGLAQSQTPPPQALCWGSKGKGIGVNVGVDGGGDSLKVSITFITTFLEDTWTPIANKLYHVGNAIARVLHKPVDTKVVASGSKNNNINVVHNVKMPEKREFVEVVLFPIINRELQKLKDSHIHIVECKIGEHRVWDSIILPEKQADNAQNRSEITEKRTLSGGKLLFLSNIVGDLTEVSIRILPIVLFLNCDLKMQMLVQSKERMHLSGTKCAFCDCNVSKKFKEEEEENKYEETCLRTAAGGCCLLTDALLNDPTTINSDDNHFKYKRCGIVHTKELADAGAIMADRLLTAIPMENRLLCMLHMELGIISTCHANILEFAQVFSIDKAHVALRKKQWNTNQNEIKRIQHEENTKETAEATKKEKESIILKLKSEGAAFEQLQRLKRKKRSGPETWGWEQENRINDLISIMQLYQKDSSDIQFIDHNDYFECSEFAKHVAKLEAKLKENERECKHDESVAATKLRELEKAQVSLAQSEQMENFLATMNPVTANVLTVLNSYGINASTQWGGTLVGHQCKKLTKNAKNIMRDLHEVFTNALKSGNYQVQGAPEKQLNGVALKECIPAYCKHMSQMLEHLHVIFGLLNSKELVSEQEVVDLESRVIPELDKLWATLPPNPGKKALSKSTPKLHMLLVHTPQWLRAFGGRLGWVTEQGIERLHVDDNQLNDRMCNQKNIVLRETYKEGMRALDTHPKVMQLILSHAAARQRDLKNSGMKRPNSATPDEGTELACKKTRN